MCILPLASSFFLKFFIFVPLHLFLGVKEVMEGVAAADQSAEEEPKGTSTDPTSSSCPPDISKSPPYSPSTVPLYSSPPTISPITISPEIPLEWNICQILLLYLLLSFFFKAILPLCLPSAPLLFQLHILFLP